MDEIIEILLSLARLSQCRPKRSVVNISDLARRSVADLRGTFPDRSVEVVIAPQMNADCDGSLLSLAIDNLFSNAWKFSAKRPDSRIEMGCRSDGDTPIYFVRDNGAGFDSVHAQGLFEPFHRMHRQTEFEGTGVGLATVHRIIQRHGGRIWAESKPMEGATFFFTLPSGQEETRIHRRKTQAPSGHPQQG